LLAGTLVVLIGLGIAFRQSQERVRQDGLRIEQLAHYDVLTGLPNRSLLQFRLSNAMAIALRNGAPLALVLFDIDGFKGVNDALGHAAGDELLVSAATRTAECMRASDTAGRLGGDEFLVILPDTGREGARIVAAKLLAALASPFDVSGERVYVSASIGGSFLPGFSKFPEQLLKEADDALYESKRRGKNRYSESPGKSVDGRLSPAQGGQLDS
jgi:diguanylate cyclase (GGDEF)-like protein